MSENILNNFLIDRIKKKVIEQRFDPYINHANEHKTIFIHVPKTGGHSICKVCFKKKPQKHIPWFRYYEKSQSKYNKFFKFAVVRNPWDRLVSAFFYQKQGGVSKKSKIWAEEYLKKYNTFEEFVLQGFENENIIRHSHFKLQSYWICDENQKIMIDYLARLETLDEDFLFISNKLGCKSKLPKLNTSKRKHYRNYYNQTTQKIVSKIYESDIKLFGYKF